jgi:phage shock protein C
MLKFLTGEKKMNAEDNSLKLNRRDRMLCGVAGGLASFFRINSFWVRLAFVIAMLTWTPTIVLYFVLYFCMDDKKPGVRNAVNNIADSKMGRHFRKVDYRKGLHKNKAKAKISGVCAGLADYLEINAFWVRLAFIVALVLGPFAIIAYILGMILMDADPNLRSNRHQNRKARRHNRRRDYADKMAEESMHGMEEDIADAEYSDVVEDPVKSYRKQAKNDESQFDINSVDDKFSKLEEKLRRLEATITSKKFKIHSEFKRMS